MRRGPLGDLVVVPCFETKDHPSALEGEPTPSGPGEVWRNPMMPDPDMRGALKKSVKDAQTSSIGRLITMLSSRCGNDLPSGGPGRP